MNKIYIVQGSTGEYSDRTDWPERAYMSEEAAKARVARLDHLMHEFGLGAAHLEWNVRRVKQKAMREHPDGDPNCQVDYTGTSYCYWECELVPE